VASGIYQETTWEISESKTILINGGGKENTIVTVGSQNYDSFIICSSGIFNFFFFHNFFFIIECYYISLLY
jgi:hypothetical protein